VTELNADVGERITEGQQIAVMDDSAYRLNVEAARAEEQRARVEAQDAQNEYSRVRRVFEMDGAISERAVEQSLALRDSAREAHNFAVSRLQLAERDLERTILRSPFSGVVAQRHVDAFQQVTRGQKVFDVFIEGAMEVAISVPESEIEYVYLGLPSVLRFPALQDRVYEGLVTEISEVAGTANAFPIRVLVDAENPAIRPGVTAEASLVLGGEAEARAYLLPISALDSGADPLSGFVFRVDRESMTVSRVPVSDVDIRGNMVAISSNIEPGDLIVTAGVSFLSDGQAVQLWNQAQ
jgi:RND family efflux transporter MFP subunit